jgi:hypothetical protein
MLNTNRAKLFFLLTISFSIFMFCYYIYLNRQLNFYDENGYVSVSKMITENGLFNIQMEVRTYLYPLLISIVTLFSDGNLEHTKIIFSLLQFLIFGLTIFYIAKTTFVHTKSQVAAYVVLVLGLCNPYLIQATTVYLTDILAACCIAIAFLRYVNKGLKTYPDAIIFFGLLFASVMIRPSGLLFVMICIPLLIYRYWIKRDFSPIKIVIAFLMTSVIFIPQLAMNVKFFNHWTPLIHNNLYYKQSVWAAEYLKYGTLVEPDQTPTLYYYAPFQVDDSMSIYSLFFSDFPKFLLLYITHIFGVLSWGDFNTYIRDTISHSGLIGSVFLSVVWFLIICGIIYLKRRKDIIYPLLFSVVFYLLFMGTTLVESRFGYPSFLLALLFSGPGVLFLVDKWKEKRNYRWITGAVFLLFVSVFVVLSYWLEMQTGRMKWF